MIKRAALLTDGDKVEARTLPFEISNFTKLQFDDADIISLEKEIEITNPIMDVAEEEIPGASLKDVVIDAEYELIFNTLKKVKFNKSKAARLLNVDRKILYNKLDQYQLLKEKK